MGAARRPFCPDSSDAENSTCKSYVSCNLLERTSSTTYKIVVMPVLSSSPTLLRWLRVPRTNPNKVEYGPGTEGKKLLHTQRVSYDSVTGESGIVAGIRCFG